MTLGILHHVSLHGLRVFAYICKFWRGVRRVLFVLVIGRWTLCHEARCAVLAVVVGLQVIHCKLGSFLLDCRTLAGLLLIEDVFVAQNILGLQSSSKGRFVIFACLQVLCST